VRPPWGHTHTPTHNLHYNLHPNPHPNPTSIPFRRSNVVCMGGGSHGGPVSCPWDTPCVTPTHPPPTPQTPRAFFPHPHPQHTIFVTLFLYPTLGLLSHSAILILPCTPGNHPPQVVCDDQRNAVHGMETLARTAGVGLTRDMVTGELGQGNSTAWHCAHDESAQGQRDSSYVQPSKGQHPKFPTRTTKNYPARRKRPLTMEVRCTRQLCMRVVRLGVWRDSLLVLLDWLGALVDGQHAQGPPLSTCDSLTFLVIH
jgi:hypothetical protein